MMGTNYYAVKKVSDENKKRIIELLMDDKYDEFESLYKDEIQKVHIGKSSCGWKFLFNYNGFKYYDLNRDSINEFLTRDDVKLYDEYGSEVSVDKFWEMVDLKSNGIDNKEYYQRYHDSYPFLMLEEVQSTDLKDYDVECYEFYSDGLRFSSIVEFS